MSRRNVYYAKRTIAKAHPDKYLCLIHDKMDQAKTNIPRLADNMKKLHMGGCLPLPTHAVRETETTFKKLPPMFMLQMDNSAKDNKNHRVFAFCSELVIRGVFEIVEVNFLMVGHTHEDVDALFSKVSARTINKDVLTLLVLMAEVWESEAMHSLLLEEVADYKTYANECLKPLIGHSQPIGFRFSMADNVPVYRTQKEVDGPWMPEGGLCLWTKVDGHILVPTGEPKALQLPTSHPRLGEVSPFIDNLVKYLQETYNDPTSEGYRKYTPVEEYWKTLKQRLTNIDSLPSDTLQTRFWPKTDHGTGFNPLVVSRETAVTAVISGDLVVDDLERELNEENDVQLQHYVGDPADRPKRAFIPLEDISEGKFVILRPNDDFEAQIPRAIWLGRAMGSVVRDTNDEHHGEFLVEWWRPQHRKSMNATDKERYSAILVGQKDWEKDPGYVRPQWINASAAIYSWKYRSKEAVPNSSKLNPLAKATIKSHFDRLDWKNDEFASGCIPKHRGFVTYWNRQS
ncbi:hypothetical protein R1sor_004956 [Riccia sorocarpa]|uniref:DUF7869 domain-containing protein n=1 Tax=Riccia sorocarpa TaxID=122646 RepID=A0ABD3HI56_9MARC